MAKGMTKIQLWKNFALGLELDTSGTFIYNGIKRLDELSSFRHPVDSFEILYGLSVGIERMLKVAIILLEHDDNTDIDELEESLITHNTLELVNRVTKQYPITLSKHHKEFLAILTNFYKSHRYGRFSFSSCMGLEMHGSPQIDQEKHLLVNFIVKHLKLDVDISSEFYPLFNSDRIKRFVGKTVRKVTDQLFSIIESEAHKANIYTTEQRGDSKAIKVFLGFPEDRLDFIDETIKKKEMLHFLMSENAKGSHTEALKYVEPLDFDTSEVPNLMKSLLDDNEFVLNADAVDFYYEEVENVKERLEFMSVMDSDVISVQHESDDDDDGLSDEIINDLTDNK